MKITTIASGSSGNCTCIGTENRNILIDAGISLKRIEAGLKSINMTPADLDGIFITHEHVDHIQGLGVLLRKYAVPVYLTEGTYEAITKNRLIGNVSDELFQVIKPDKEFAIGDMKAEAYAVSHDAAEPVVYRFTQTAVWHPQQINAQAADAVQTQPDTSFAIVTDLGMAPDSLIERLQDLDGIILEANHDIRMLQAGPYPYKTKQRILSDLGHLSNESAADLLLKLNNPALSKVILGHISKTNNYEKLAYETLRLEMNFNGLDEKMLSVASATQPGEPIIL